VLVSDASMPKKIWSPAKFGCVEPPIAVKSLATRPVAAKLFQTPPIRHLYVTRQFHRRIGSTHLQTVLKEEFLRIGEYTSTLRCRAAPASTASAITFALILIQLIALPDLIAM
jgi:hypothetical protein